MDAFSTTGFWWLPATPDAQVAGSIHFDPSDGTQLNLLGTLTESADALHIMLSEERRFETVHGVADGSFYTLVDCLCTGSKLQSPGFQSEDYNVRLWLRGSALVDGGDLFTEMVLEYEYLDEWAGVGRLGVQSIHPTQSGEVHSHVVSYVEIGNTATLADGTTIELHTSHPGQFGYKSFEIQSECQFHIKSPKPLSLSELGKLAGRCQNFVTLLCDDPSATKSYTVIAEGGALLEVGSQFVFVRHGPTPNRVGAQMLRPPTLADFGTLMTTWFALYESNDRSLNTYFGLVYAPPTYTEIRFVTAATAAEGLHSGVAESDPDERIKTQERKANILAAVKPALEDEDYAWIDALLIMQVDRISAEGSTNSGNSETGRR